MKDSLKVLAAVLCVFLFLGLGIFGGCAALFTARDDYGGILIIAIPLTGLGSGIVLAWVILSSRQPPIPPTPPRPPGEKPDQNPDYPFRDGKS